MEWWQIQGIITTGGITLAGLILVAGVTVRFAIKPFLKDWRELKGPRPTPFPEGTDPRLDRMELQLDHLEGSVNRLLEMTEFDRQLKSGEPPKGS